MWASTHCLLVPAKYARAVPIVQCPLATPVCLDVDQLLGLLDQSF